MKQAIFSLLLLLSMTLVPAWAFLSVASLYTFRYSGYVPLGIAALADLYYGGAVIRYPWYTITMLIAVILIEYVKPIFIMYNQK